MCIGSIMTDDNTENTIYLAVDIVSAFVANNTVSSADLPGLIEQVHAALAALGKPIEAESPVKRDPAVPIKKSVTPDHIICLEDGRPFRSLKRHLQASYGLTPDEYRAKWGLPHDYPMVAPNYAAARSALAKELGLGRRPAPAPEPKPVARARKQKVA